MAWPLHSDYRGQLARLHRHRFSGLDGDREPIRVRAGYPTDEEIAAMAVEYGPGSSPAGRLRAALKRRVDGRPMLTDAQPR